VQGAVGIDRETNPLVSVPRAVGMTADLTSTFLAGLKRLVSGDVSRKQLAGPIGIAEIAHNAFEQGWFAYLTTLILISINLAVLNLLPIPVLDGGQALLIAIEGVKRSPLSIRTRDIVQQIGVTVMVMLMAWRSGTTSRAIGRASSTGCGTAPVSDACRRDRCCSRSRVRRRRRRALR